MQSNQTDHKENWPFREGDWVSHRPKKSFGIDTGPKKVRLLKIYPSGFSSIELRCGRKKTVYTTTLSTLVENRP